MDKKGYFYSFFIIFEILILFIWNLTYNQNDFFSEIFEYLGAITIIPFVVILIILISRYFFSKPKIN